jgi:hypothetical protein
VFPPDEEMEQFLSAARPTPRDSFVHTLESSLFDSPPAKPRRAAWFRRPLLTAGAVSAALAAVALLLGLFGLSPLGAGGDDPAAAGECRTTTEVRWVKRPQLELGADGQFHTEHRKQKVYVEVKRCP